MSALYPASAGTALTAPLWFGPLGFLLWPAALLLGWAWLTSIQSENRK